MWDFTGGRPDRTHSLGLGFTLEPAAEPAAVPSSNDLIAVPQRARGFRISD